MQYDFYTFLLWNAKAIVFGIVLNLKSYFGPIVVAFVLSWQVYFFFEYQELRAIPMVSALAAWVFEFGPEWLAATYLVVQTVYCLISSGIDSAVDWSP